MNLDRLTTHLESRPEQLRELKKNGTKIIGYFPGNYVPEELIYASGAVPLCLIHAGNSRAAEAGLSVFPRVICPFARAQVGERLLNENPFYTLLDMVVAPITCQHLKKVGEFFEYQGDLEIFKLGVPHQHDNDFEQEYYRDRIIVLRDRLEAFTGNKISPEKISEAITLYNRMRELLRNLSLLRRDSPSPLSSLDFIRMNHVSFYADPVFVVDFLEAAYDELNESRPSAQKDAPRILLIGPNLGYGDYRIPELILEAGGEIVIEELCEGIRNYWHDIADKGDRYESLAKGYLIDRVPCGFVRNSSEKRLEFALELVNDFKVDGIVWYELLCCETYDSESYFFAKKMAERNIPMLILESDYDTSDTGQIKTRLEAFIEIVKGGV